MKILLAPDVYVNASVAGTGLAPEQVVNRVLGNTKSRQRTTEWVLTRVEAMLTAHPHFNTDAVVPHLEKIRSLVDIVDMDEFEADDWKGALTASAKAADFARVVTDHPDLADKDEIDGVEFLSTDAWMIEQITPPPPPPPGAAKPKKADEEG